MASSVEMRSPFLDYKLAQWLTALPANLTWYRNREKYLAKLNEMNGFTHPAQVKTVDPVVEEESDVSEDSSELTEGAEGAEVVEEKPSADENSGETEDILVTKEPSLGDEMRLSSQPRTEISV